MKQCNHCKQFKDESCFHKNCTMPDGLQRQCKDCNREFQRKYLSTHREQRRAINKRQRDFGCKKIYIEKHQESIRAYMREYYRTHKAKWKSLKYHRQARVKANGGRFTDREWIALCNKYGNVCLCCGQAIKLVVDHVIPICKGGRNSIDNIQPLCQPCNRKKHMKTIDYRV